MSKFEELINSTNPLLVNFFSESYWPCKLMNPILKEVVLKIGKQATIIKVDINKNLQTAQLFGVTSVPTVIVFKKGEILWRQSGIIPADKLVNILGIVI